MRRILACLLGLMVFMETASSASTPDPDVACRQAYHGSVASGSCELSSLRTQGDHCVLSAKCRRTRGNWQEHPWRHNTDVSVPYSQMYRLRSCDGWLKTPNTLAEC